MTQIRNSKTSRHAKTFFISVTYFCLKIWLYLSCILKTSYRIVIKVSYWTLFVNLLNIFFIHVIIVIFNYYLYSPQHNCYKIFWKFLSRINSLLSVNIIPQNFYDSNILLRQFGEIERRFQITLKKRVLTRMFLTKHTNKYEI